MDELREIDDVLLTIDMIDEIETIERYRRGETSREDFCETLNETDFLARFRMSKRCFANILSKIRDKLEHGSQRNNPFSPAGQLQIALRFYATGILQINNGDFFDVSQATVSRIVKKVSFILCELAPQYIHMPTVAEVTQIKRDFYSVARFPDVVGTIDCTHIKLESVGGPNFEVYRNRKGFYSLNVQTVSDAHLKIRNIVVRWPGSTHNSTIFENSRVKVTMESGVYGNGYLLGYSGYDLQKYLLTPYLNPGTASQERYNSSHTETLNTVERQHGLLKRRFPALQNGLRLKIDTSPAVIMACAVLHNICIELNEQEPTEDQIHEEEDIFNNYFPETSQSESEVNDYRNHIANQYFS